MALPLSRNTTYAALTPLLSADMNAIQDQIVAIHARTNGCDWLNWQRFWPSDDNSGIVSNTIGWEAVAFRDAVAFSDRAFVATAYDKIYLSIDGISWGSQTVPAGWGAALTAPRTAIWSQVASRFILLSGNAAYGLAYSTTGVAWTGVADPAGLAIRWAIAESSSIVVICRASGPFLTSTDGITWTQRTHPAADKDVRDIAWSPALGLFCAVTATGTRLTSPDGITWTNRGNPNAIPALSSIVWNAHHAVFVAQNAATGATERSPDGVTWTAGGTTLAASYLGGHTMISDGKAIYSVRGVLERSDDGGLTWTATNAAGVTLWAGITKLDGRLALFGRTGSNKPIFSMSVKLVP